MTNDEILDIRMRAFEEAAQIADEMAAQNRASAVELHQRSARLAKVYGRSASEFGAGFEADQTKISAQVLDACAEEAESIAFRIRARKPGGPAVDGPPGEPTVSPADFVEGGGDDGVERNPVPARFGS